MFWNNHTLYISAHLLAHVIVCQKAHSSLSNSEHSANKEYPFNAHHPKIKATLQTISTHSSLVLENKEWEQRHGLCLVYTGFEH